jgi:hypothetical protein
VLEAVQEGKKRVGLILVDCGVDVEEVSDSRLSREHFVSGVPVVERAVELGVSGIVLFVDDRAECVETSDGVSEWRCDLCVGLIVEFSVPDGVTVLKIIQEGRLEAILSVARSVIQGD